MKTMMLMTVCAMIVGCGGSSGESSGHTTEAATGAECLVAAGCHEVAQCSGAPECAQVANLNGQYLDLFSCPSKPNCQPDPGTEIAIGP